MSYVCNKYRIIYHVYHRNIIAATSLEHSAYMSVRHRVLSSMGASMDDYVVRMTDTYIHAIQVENVKVIH